MTDFGIPPIQFIVEESIPYRDNDGNRGWFIVRGISFVVSSIGVVKHYYGKIKVAVVNLDGGEIQVKDKVAFMGRKGFEQIVTSLEKDHKKVHGGRSGDEIAVKVDRPVERETEVMNLTRPPKHPFLIGYLERKKMFGLVTEALGCVSDANTGEYTTHPKQVIDYALKLASDEAKKIDNQSVDDIIARHQNISERQKIERE